MSLPSYPSWIHGPYPFAVCLLVILYKHMIIIDSTDIHICICIYRKISAPESAIGQILDPGIYNSKQRNTYDHARYAV
jgi:hypothetical protein